MKRRVVARLENPGPSSVADAVGLGKAPPGACNLADEGRLLSTEKF